MKRLVFACLMVLAYSLSACGSSGSSAPSAPAADIPVTLSKSGDAAKGKLYFENEGGCSACHAITNEKLIGPGLAGLFTGNGPKLPDGVDYKGNLSNGKPRTEENMAAWIREGGQGQIGSMSPHPMDDTQMADLLAYLRTLK